MLAAVVAAAVIAYVVTPDLSDSLARMLGWNQTHGGGQATATSSGIPPGAPIGGPFVLIDQLGRTVTQASFRGRWMLVYFGYSRCPDECPLMLEKMAVAMRALGPLAKKVVPVFMTVDPGHDTPDLLKTYLHKFGGHIVGLTGPEPAIAKVAKEYDAYFSAGDHEASGKSLVSHSTYLYLMGPDGKFDNLFPVSITVPQLVQVLRSAVAGSAAPPVGSAAYPETQPLYLTTSKPMPAFGFSSASGHPLALVAFRGKLLLLNIWATWCAPCRKEMPALDRLQATLGDRQFEVLPISIDSGGLEAVRKFYAETGIRHLGIFLDPSGNALQVLALEGVPTSFLTGMGDMGTQAAEFISAPSATPSGFMAHGRINSINASTGLVNITHQAIKALGWPGMTMDFQVQDKRVLQALKAGDEVDFDLAKGPSGQYVVTKLHAAR